MPIYEYECLACGETFEKRQSFSDDSLANCPNGHEKTRRLLSAPAIVFKGSGFYINDSKSSKNGINGASKNAKPESKPEKKSGAKPDTTSEKSTSKTQTEV